MSDYAPAVREYLAYCARAAAELATRGSALENHPSEAGCVKMIPHNSVPAEAAKIREAFRELTEPAEPA